MPPYNHPYTPYDIQIQLMDSIYDTVENGYKVGLFESPTGTGKTLSIICSTMTWLRQYKKTHSFKDALDSDASDSEDEPEWVKQAYERSVISQTKGVAQDYEKHLDAMQSQYASLVKYDDARPLIKKKRPAQAADDDFLLEDYYSDSEVTTTTIDKNSAISREIKQLLEKLNQSSTSESSECPVLIFFSSRTHSQLNQFAHQLNMTSFDTSLDPVPERTKFLPLGSRKQLCIHPKVSKLSNVTTMNDACMDLQKNKDEKCQFLPNDSDIVKKFSDLSFTHIHDIEDLNTLGSNLKICPYYSVRNNVDPAEIIALPYQILLQESTREIMNLKIDNSIVVIDEAHNLIDTITAMNSVSLSLGDCESLILSLKTYQGKFLRRLNSGNRINLMKLTKLCQLLLKYMKTVCCNLKNGDEIMVNRIFEGTTGDLLNVHKIEKFLNKSRIAYKLESYMEGTGSSSNPLLFKVTEFLKKLNNSSSEGKFFWDKSSASINYMLLDPSQVFKDITDRARCVLLCGGTMEPMDDFLNYLFPYISPEKVRKFSCGHIIPKSNLKVFPVASMDSVDFEFLFDKRNNPAMLTKLGEMVAKMCCTIPDGVVVFFPSYKYLAQVIDHWKKTGLWNKITKKIFEEGGGVESVLTEYTQAVKSGNGAILFSVVGGRMSEGINFSDELARAVVMVGLPYPNAFLAEIVAKQRFIETTTLARGGSSTEAKRKCHDFYENICMRSVNQSIGRSIRHINDYSVIFLVDVRYGRENIQHKLSKWVRERIEQKTYTYNSLEEETKEFFMTVR